MFKLLFKGNNKFFSLSVILFIVILIIGFYEPAELKKTDLNWNEIRVVRNEEIAQKASQVIKKRNAEFLRKFNGVFSTVKSAARKGNFSTLLYNVFPGTDYSLLVWKDSTLVFWKNETISDTNFENRFSPREVFFDECNLTADLAVYDTFSIGQNRYFVKMNETVEKFYKFENEYFSPKSLTEVISEEVNVDCKINFSSDAKISKDEKTFSFPIYNNFNNKIGMLYLPKIQASFEKRKLQRKFSAVQNSLTILIFILFSVGFYKEVKEKNKRWEVVTLFVLLLILRYALFWLEIPKIFLRGRIIQPQYFSSAFGFGVVSSPLELFLTLSFFLAFTFYLLIRIKNQKTGKFNVSQRTVIIVLFVAAIVSPLVFRGFAASVKSFIFQSNLEYFNRSELLPDSLTALMLVNLLILGVSFSNLFLLLFVFVFNNLKTNVGKSSTLLIFFLFEFALFSLFIHPILSVAFKLAALIFLIYLSYFIWKSISSNIWNYFFLIFFSSVFTLLVLSNFNEELRKESLKVAAQEINRPKENLYGFWLTRLLNGKETESILKAVEKGKITPAAAAMRIWSISPFQKDDVPISLKIVDSSGSVTGEFNYKFTPYGDNFNSDSLVKKEQVKIETLGNGQRVLEGIGNSEKNVFVVAYVLPTVGSNEIGTVPKFVETKRFLNRIRIESGDFFSLRVTNPGVKFIFGKPNFSAEQIKKIKNVKFSERREAWLKTEVDGKRFQLYLLKGRNGISVVGLKENSLAFTWFHFIRLFFFHSLIISLIFLLAVVFYVFKKRKLKFTFRMKLTLAFFVTAVIPLILLASYLRYTTKAKNAEAIDFKLTQRARQVERYFASKMNYENFYSVLQSANRDLDINFSVFNDSLISFSSYVQYYNAGLLPPLADYKAVTELLRNKKNKILLNKRIEKLGYHSVFYRAGLKPNFIIEVNDAFNSIRLPMSQGEFDIFLFGIYALAFIFALIISTVLANQISNPIHILTRATASVGRGDLNVHVKDSFKGEVGELAKGFNFMVKELRKSQKELSKLQREIAWKEMARQVAHEIKNPLTPMKLSVQHLLAAFKDNSPKFPEILERVTKTLIEQIETLKNIASEFGNLAKMPKPKLEKLNIVNVIKDAETLFRDENIQIEIETFDNEIFILGDEDNLRRIFVNLIRNSVQAKSTFVRFKIEERGESIIIRVKDNGKGIPEEYQDKIFDLDFTTKPDGMGIGLSIGKKFLETIDAEISLEESSSEGTTFKIVFKSDGKE